MNKSYRRYYRIFLILFLLSFGVNLFVLILHFKERITWRSFFTEGRGAKEVQEAKWTKELVPIPIVHIKDKEYFLLCEKNSKTLYLCGFEQNHLSLIKSYPCIVGSNNGDKREAGDLATPEGIYFLISYLAKKDLPERYGSGAFSLNYPNFLDQKVGKKGSGIWLHGSPDHMERPVSSEGCVVVKNEVLNELMAFIKIGDTPLVIVDTIKYQPYENQLKLSQSSSDFLMGWKRAWESLDTEKYLRFYSRDFVSSDGKDYVKLREHKFQVNRSKKFIKLEIEPKTFLLSQKDEGRVAILKINQGYHSDNFNSYNRKILCLREEQGKWEIIGESSLEESNGFSFQEFSHYSSSAIFRGPLILRKRNRKTYLKSRLSSRVPIKRWMSIVIPEGRQVSPFSFLPAFMEMNRGDTSQQIVM